MRERTQQIIIMPARIQLDPAQESDWQADRQTDRQPRRQPASAAALVCGNEVTGFQIANRGSQGDAAVCRLCRSHCVSLAGETDRGGLFSPSDTSDSGPIQRYKQGRGKYATYTFTPLLYHWLMRMGNRVKMFALLNLRQDYFLSCLMKIIALNTNLLSGKVFKQKPTQF